MNEIESCPAKKGKCLDAFRDINGKVICSEDHKEYKYEDECPYLQPFFKEAANGKG